MSVYSYRVENCRPLIFLDGVPYMDTDEVFPSEKAAVAWAEQEIEGLVSFVPLSPLSVPLKPVLTKWQFRSKFSFTERVAITSAAETDAGVKVIVDDLNVVDEVDLGDPAVASSLDYLISKGLLTEQRKQEILS